MRILVTGSSGLIGSEAVRFFDRQGFAVWGVDNNMRREFFGDKGDTSWNRQALQQQCEHFQHLDVDIRDRGAVDRLLADVVPDLIIHAAAQPSHDLAAQRPLDDFDVNAAATLYLLEACRQHAPEAVFVFVSTNKVYGDGPNRVRLKELQRRFDFDDPRYDHGIAEDFPVDHCLHSLFGVSKLSADLMVQEYGRYFGMRTGVFRCGCVTGPAHAGVQLHGFLNYLVHVALHEGAYTIFGYRGKQVRDQIHAHDLVSAFWHFAQAPRAGAVYNLGGGKENAASILECIELIKQTCGKRPSLTYRDENRIGDHICYYTDARKFRSHYPSWQPQHGLTQIVSEIAEELTNRSGAPQREEAVPEFRIQP